MNFHDEIRKNNQKSMFLVFVFLILIGILASVLGLILGNVIFGLVIGMVGAVIYTLVVFSSGSDMILSMTGAKPVTKQEYPHLYHTVEGLAIAAGLKNTPKCYVIHDTALNAFATGKNQEKAVIVVTTGLLDKLNRQELEGVVAHEMSHILNEDIKVMMLAAVLVGITVLISDILLRSFIFGGSNRDDNNGGNLPLIVVGIVLAILAPIVAYLIKLGISRKREFMADASGAKLTRYPQGLADALKKISQDPDPLVDNANKATAHLFISTPFRNTKGWLTGLFSTHPPISERIRRLENM